ncbi:hypothetical protein GSI_04809 [Ganoderma sinense ZZ0214-1]|uniref:Mid2 domain-containing protein n=1 Tax=Ganoderma sinense ZZ0214-1 TaxID=1077348 RepID=A0A2G8SIH0_9APHY|nr:hypothetical protein GSI_04809 [Ganoderma sinense ZZ0214-1]
MNFTVDDSDPSISYSANGWAVQSQNDPDVGQFFQKTYHVATQDQATMVFQFSGTAFTLYGSKGPSHATFDVQYDGNKLDGVGASASTTAFRQALFSYSFGGTAAQHLVNVTAHLEGQNRWFDLDYITFTGNGTTSSPSIGTATTAPPWLTSSSSTGPSGLSIPSSTAASSSSSSASSNKVPTILAALFGAILGGALLSLLAWFVLRRVRARRRARERAFRYGQSSVNPAAAGGGGGGGGGGVAPTAMSSVKGSVYPPSSSNSAPSALMMRERERERTTTPYSHSQHDGSLIFASNAAELQSVSVSVDERERERERERVATPATTAASKGGLMMSQSPIAWTARKMGGGHRGDADSLRTDFLQV